MKRRLSFLMLALAAILALPNVAAVAQTVNLPTVELLGGKYYVYKANKGDTLFGIADKYNWDYNVLRELNKSVVEPMKKGMVVYYPVKIAVANPLSDVKTPPVATEQDRDVYHKIKRGDTVYAIASMYGVTVEHIYALNPGSRNGIKAGESLLINKGETLPDGELGNENGVMFYTVKYGDTLYGLSKKFNVSVASIMQNNAGVDEKNFKAGSIVKIPKRGTGIVTTRKTVEEENLKGVEVQQVSKDDTWSSLAEQTGVDEKLLKEANPTVTELKNKDFIAVPKVEKTVTEVEVETEDPRLQTPSGIGEIYDDLHNRADISNEEEVTVKVAVICENPESKKDAEFLRGFLTGIDRQKRNDYKIAFKVINATEEPAVVIETLDDFKPSIVFNTFESQTPSYLNEYANVSCTPVVNAFDVKSESYTENPYIVQLLTPSSLFNDNIAHAVKKRFEGYKLLMIGTEDKNDQLAEALLAIWEPSLVKHAPTEAVKPKAFSDDGRYLIYGYDVKKEDVKTLLDKVIAVRDAHPLADIAVLGRPNLIVYEDAMIESFKKANVSIPSRFYIEKDSPENKEFLQRYKLMFDRTPAKSMPLYAAVGYDTSNYFISALAKARGDINKLYPSRHTVQSEYELWRPNNWSGLLNPPVFLIDYTPYGAVIKNVISGAE